MPAAEWRSRSRASCDRRRTAPRSSSPTHFRRRGGRAGLTVCPGRTSSPPCAPARAICAPFALRPLHPAADLHCAAVNGPPPSLLRLCAAVDVILAAVEQSAIASSGPAPRDVNDTFLGAAYGRAYRCLRSIRELADRGEADDALVLTRTLLSIVARALYVVQPE